MKTLRKELDIFRKAYDLITVDMFDLYINDKHYLLYYFPILIYQVLKVLDWNGCIYIANHSNQSEVNWPVSKVEKISRLVGGVRW